MLKVLLLYPMLVRGVFYSHACEKVLFYPLRSFVARPPARGDNAVCLAKLIFHVGDVSIIPLAVYLAYQIPLRSVLLVLFPLRNILQMHFIGLTLSAFSPLAGGVPVGRGGRGLRGKEYRRRRRGGRAPMQHASDLFVSPGELIILVGVIATRCHTGIL